MADCEVLPPPPPARRVKPSPAPVEIQEAPQLGRPVTEYLKMPIFGSMKQCEAVAHIPLHMQKEAKDAGCTAFHNSNRVALEPLLAWIFSDDRDDGEKPLKKVYDHYHGQREKLKFEREAEQTLFKAEVGAAINKSMSLLFASLDKLSDSLPGLLHGMDAPEIKTKLAESNESLKAELRTAFETLTKPPLPIKARRGKGK